MDGRALNRATLARQGLLRRERLGVREGLRRVLALQAQHPASAYLALWNRLEGFAGTELDGAFASGEVVRSNLMRVTLHVVLATEYGTIREAMERTLRGARLGDRRFMESGLSIPDAEALVPEMVAFAVEPRTTREFQAWLEARVGGAWRGAWWALRHYAPLVRAPEECVWSFGASASFVGFAAARVPVGEERSAAALRVLVLRYLEAFGPATVADVAQFAMVQRARVREALRAVADDVERLEGPDRKEFFDVPEGVRPPGETPAPPRLLSMWDSVLLAYSDRSRVIPPEFRAYVIRVNGDVLPTVLVDGFVAGVWRAWADRIEVRAFRPLPPSAWRALEEEAGALLGFLAARDPEPFRAYHHWWVKLPDGETRFLGAV